MNRRVPLLNGIAILGVVISHAFAWGLGIMSSSVWVERFDDLPYYNRIGGVAYYFLILSRPLLIFCVPAFFVVSGFFLAFTNRGMFGRLTFRVAFTRVINLLIPFVFWSIVIFFANFLLYARRHDTILEYANIFMFHSAEPQLYFVPLLCYFYIISPVLVPIVKKHPWIVLIIAFVIQYSLTILSWMETYHIYTLNLPYLGTINHWFPTWWLPRWIFFGSLGIYIGFNQEQIRDWVAKYWRPIIIITILMAVFTVYEERIADILKPVNPDLQPRLAELPFSILIILTFLIFSIEKTAASKTLLWLGSRIFGIFLIHFMFMDYLVRGLALVFPAPLAYQIILQPLLIGIGIAGPILLMELVGKSPLRKYHRYLFG
jgi:membrane-bound acyltransferase YfiQ involved in biofilm formation